MAKTRPLLGVSLAAAVRLSGAARAAVLWDGDAGKGGAVWAAAVLTCRHRRRGQRRPA